MTEIFFFSTNLSERKKKIAAKKNKTIVLYYVQDLEKSVPSLSGKCRSIYMSI